MRDLSDLTYNNAVGLGMADVVTDRLVNRIDWEPTRINSLTANTPAAIRTPIHFPTDRECLERIAPTVGKFDLRRGHHRLDPQHHGAGPPGAERKSARRRSSRTRMLEIEATIDFDFDGAGQPDQPLRPGRGDGRRALASLAGRGINPIFRPRINTDQRR